MQIMTKRRKKVTEPQHTLRCWTVSRHDGGPCICDEEHEGNVD